MHPKIEKKFTALNRDLNKMLSHTDALNEAALHRKPDGAWSPAQILHHLLLSEKGTLSYLNKKLDGNQKIEKSGLGATLRAFALSKALRSHSKKFKAPSMVANIPDKPDYREVKSEYLKVRNEMRGTLEKFDHEMIGRAYFKHPRAGKLNILQTLDFLQDHLQRHAAQIDERTKKE